MKKYYFLTGLPRAGNTLLSSIINQNPDVVVTAYSPVGDFLRGVSECVNWDMIKHFPDMKSHDNIMRGVIPNYYSHWNQNHIIDRHAWGRKTMVDLLKLYNTNDIKMIVLVRDMAEVIASFIKLSNTTPNNFIKQGGKTIDEQVDYLLLRDGQIDIALDSIKNLLLPENKDITHFVEYNDLVKNPKKEIDSIYDFLDIPKFDHRYVNLQQFKTNGVKYNETHLGVDLHHIRTNSIKKADYNVEDILPHHIIEKCKVLNIWK
jgi:sulfotransferase